MLFLLGSPPLTRELLCFCPMNILRHRITPAYAGTTLHYEGPYARYQDHPRLRGNYYLCILFFSRCITDHPRLRGNYLGMKSSLRNSRGSPPLTRELREQLQPNLNRFRITPAYAGTTLKAKIMKILEQDHPRLRGNYLLKLIFKSPEVGSPPLTRELQSWDTFMHG